MINEPKKCIPYEEALVTKAMPKFIHGDFEWKNEPAGSLMWFADFKCYNEKHESISGLTVEFVAGAGRISGECKFLFTLFELRGTDKLRVFQIEVRPPHISKHREDSEAWFGPHQHIGCANERVSKSVNHLGCADVKEWYEHFLFETNMKHDGKWVYPQPQPDLTGI